MERKETMPSSKEKETPLKDILQEYRDEYEKIKDSVERLTSEEKRSKLEDFLKKNPSLAKDSEKKERLLKDEQAAKAFVILGIVQENLEYIRKKILSHLENEMKGKTAQERYQILKSRFSEMKDNELINSDVQLMVDLMIKLTEAETHSISERYSKPEKAELIKSGKKWIQNGGEKPEALKEDAVPQQLVLCSFRIAFQFQAQYEALRQELVSGKVKNLKDFTDLTFGAFQRFLRDNKFPVDQFGPDQDWYQKLCESLGMTDNSFASLDVSQILKGKNHLELIENAKRISEENKKRAIKFRQEKEGFSSEAKSFRQKAAEFEESGKSKDAKILKGRAEELEKLAAESEGKEKYFGNMAKATESLAEKTEESVRNSYAGKYLFPKLNIGYLKKNAYGVFAMPFRAASAAMDWVGGLVPEPRSVMDMNAGNMMFGAVKVSMAAAIGLNFLGLSVGAGKAIKNLIGSFIPLPGYFQPIKGTGEFLKEGWNMIYNKGTWGSLATAGLAYTVLRTDSPKSAEKWVRKTAGYVYDEGKTFVKKNDKLGNALSWSREKASNAMTWYGEKWKSFGKESGLKPKEVKAFREFIDSMKALANHVSSELNKRTELKPLGMETRTEVLNTEELAKFAKKYITDNAVRVREASLKPLPISLMALTEAGFLYRGGERVTKESLEADQKYKKLNPEQKNISISEALSQQIISQKAFLDRNKFAPKK